MVIISNQYYKIHETSQHKVLVTVLTCEMTEVYWTQLQDDIHQLNLVNANVYFDFIYRNGMRDRYYRLSTDSKSKIKDTLLPCRELEDIEVVADEFFAKNLHLIRTSVLSSFQKQFYINKLKRLYKI